MTKEKEKEKKTDIFSYFLITIFFMLFVSGFLFADHKRTQHNQEIKLSDFSVETSMIHNLLYPDVELLYLAPDICTEIIETQVFICNDPYDKYTSLYNMTQEQFNTVINGCNEGVFRNSKVCIGEYLTLNEQEISD